VEGANADLWEQVAELCERHDVPVTWVPGHAGDEGTNAAISLALRGGARNGVCLADKGYEHPRSIPVRADVLMRCRDPSARERLR